MPASFLCLCIVRVNCLKSRWPALFLSLLSWWSRAAEDRNHASVSLQDLASSMSTESVIVISCAGETAPRIVLGRSMRDVMAIKVSKDS